MRLRYLAIPVLVTVSLLSIIVFTLPAGRVEILVNLFNGLAWPLALLVIVIAFWPQLQKLADELVRRAQQGASFQLPGGFSVGSLPEQAARIPSPPATESVSLANIALMHTSFLRPDKTRELNDGRTYFQFEVIVMAPDDVLGRVESVRYELEAAWPEHLRVRTVTDRASRFKLKELANGTSIVTARIDLRGQDQPVVLNRFIDLQPDGPRL
jgi:hypothetical protein